MLAAVFVMTVLGVFVGAGLAVASRVFYVYVDPKIEAIEDVLPGANCGGCGYPGCSANAAAMVKGESSPSSCVAAGPGVSAEIADILGVKLEIREPDIASPGCTYGVQDADLKLLYDGVYDCRAAVLINGGPKVCPIGCIGLGTCVKACPFGALSMGDDNLPKVDPRLCTGCGTCERVCPKHIITLTSNTRRIQHEFTTDQCTAPCQRACPAGIDIPAYIHEISQGNYLEAVRVIKETNPFPLVCGRICVHPCEYECRRNLVDEPVAINHLKRFAADYEMNSNQRVQIPRAPERNQKVAVVGGGAEGLTASYFLNRLGYESVVYESGSRLGGLLRTGIPQNRLPKNVLDWEIQGILDVGVRAFTRQQLGKDFTINDLLKNEFSAVLIATGGWDTHLFEVSRGAPRQILPGILSLVDFLMAYRDGNPPLTGKRVMILGGGQAAVQTADTCLQCGADEVSIVFRKSRQKAPLKEQEITDAESRGIRFLFNTGLTKMLGRGDQLTQVEVMRISTGGEVEGDVEALKIDTLLTAAGRFPELIYTPLEEEEAQVGQDRAWETLPPYASPFAEADIGIFRPGEVVSDYRAVVEAIGAGRRAANSIDQKLSGKPVKAPDNMIRRLTPVLSLTELSPVKEVPRQPMPLRSSQEQIADPSAEAALGYSEAQARQEADRCLQCGLICYRRIREN